MLKLITDRTELRILSVNDVGERYVEWLNDPDINRYLESRHSRHTLESTRQFVSRVIEDPKQYLFGIFLQNEHIGNVKLGPVLDEHKRANLGLMIGVKEYWGRGIGVEVIRAVVQFSFNQLGLQKVDAGCYESHVSSKKTFIKAGFDVECLLPKHVIFNGRREGIYLLGILAH